MRLSLKGFQSSCPYTEESLKLLISCQNYPSSFVNMKLFPHSFPIFCLSRIKSQEEESGGGSSSGAGWNIQETQPVSTGLGLGERDPGRVRQSGTLSPWSPQLSSMASNGVNSCSSASVALPITARKAGRCERNGITALPTDKEAATEAQIVSVKVFRCWI